MSGTESPIQVVAAEGETHVVRLVGEIDIATVGGLADALCSMPASVVIADLTEVTFADTSCINQLILAKRLIESSGNELIIRGATSTVRRPFELLGLSEMLEGCPSELNLLPRRRPSRFDEADAAGPAPAVGADIPRR